MLSILKILLFGNNTHCRLKPQIPGNISKFTKQKPKYHNKPLHQNDTRWSMVFCFLTVWSQEPKLLGLNIQSSLKLMSIESVMPSNHLILCHPLLLLPSVFTSISFVPPPPQWVSYSYQVAKVLELQPQHQSFYEYSGVFSNFVLE